jgi:transcriptional regulator with XRE-family HTH domain
VNGRRVDEALHGVALSLHDAKDYALKCRASGAHNVITMCSEAMTATKPGTVVANGDAIRRNRNASGLSREALSLNSLVSVATIRRAEASKRVQSTALRAIAATLKVAESRLIKRNEQGEACETEIKEIWESIVKVLNQKENRPISRDDLLDIFPNDEFDTLVELHSLLFFGIVHWDEDLSLFMNNLDISLSDGWTNRFSSENFADLEPSKIALEKFLGDLIKFYTRVITGFAKNNKDQIELYNCQRRQLWDEDLANAGPRLWFPEIVGFFEARGLCYSKIIGCLRALVKHERHSMR